MNFISKLAILFCLSIYSLFAYGAGDPIDETLDVDPDGQIYIENEKGTVTISGWDKPQISVQGTLAEDATGYTLETRNGKTHFVVEMPGNDSWWDGIKKPFSRTSRGDGSDLTIRVPLQHQVSFEGVDCDVVANQIQGGIKLATVNGDIKASDISPEVQLSSVNGGIELHRASGNVEIETVNGDISDLESSATQASYAVVNGDLVIDTQATQVRLESVNGDMDLNLATVKRLEIETVNGDAESDLILADDGRIRISSVSGDMRLNFRETPGARFDINANAGGDIDNNLTDHRPETAKYGPSSWLEFDLSNGSESSGRVNISTVNGDITLDKASD